MVPGKLPAVLALRVFGVEQPRVLVSGAEAEEAGAGVAGLPGAGELGELRGGGELAADPGLHPPLLPPLVAARAAGTLLTQPLEAGEVTDGEEDNKAEK